MPGAELQLAAYGDQDANLTGNPQMTYFVAVYKRHTNFAIENIEELFVGQPVFGGKSYIVLGQHGDLINKIYLNVVLPALNPTHDPTFAISWVNAIGHALIKKIEFSIGGIKIDEQYGLWMEIWYELTVPAEKRWGYNDMIGRHEYYNVTMQQDELHLRIPLQFWFCRHIGLSIPSVALQSHQIRITIIFSEFEQLYVSSTGNLDPIFSNGEASSGSRTAFIQNNLNIRHASLFVDYIFLGEDERRYFANNPHSYLIEQMQSNVITEELKTINNVINLDFNHPVKEIIWIIRDCVVFKRVPGGGNDWFNFSDTLGFVNRKPGDPMISALLWFESQQRFDPRREAKYFREVEPAKYHTNIPDNYIYVYSFALHPEQYQPSGTCNFSMLDNVQLNVRIKDTLLEPEINIFAVNYNILQIRDGMAGLLYLD